MLLLCDHSIYLAHALHTSCLPDAPRNFSNDFPQVRTEYYTIVTIVTTEDGHLMDETRMVYQ
jgi:hypothetical protein